MSTPATQDHPFAQNRLREWRPAGAGTNRATLARQLLLERRELSPLDAVRHLVGLQAQVPNNPYTALWSRLAGFRPESLSKLLGEREVVRIGVMRGTIHLITADDCLVLRPVTQPVFEGQLWGHRDLSPPLRGVDLDQVVETGRLALEEPRTGTELRALLAARFPTFDAAAIAYACQMRLALVQVPPRGLWRKSAQFGGRRRRPGSGGRSSRRRRWTTSYFAISPRSGPRRWRT